MVFKQTLFDACILLRYLWGNTCGLCPHPAVHGAEKVDIVIVIIIYMGSGKAQLVESGTKKPGIVLTWVRFPSVARDFSPRVDFWCRLSYGVRTSPSYMHNICAHGKKHKLAAIPLFGHPKILQRTDRNG